MKNSSKFKIKLVLCRVCSILLSILIMFVITKYIIFELIPYFEKLIVITIGLIINLIILIITLYYVLNLVKFNKEEKSKIYYDLDNNVEKEFKYFGLYITKNYIIYLGNKLNLFRIFVIPIKEITAVDTRLDSRYHHNRKKGFGSFIKASIKTNIREGKDPMYIFNILCGKKVYNITSCSKLNKIKLKRIDEVADYICDKYKNINYI